MKKRKVLLFGGNGFLGSKLIKELKNDIAAPSHTELDLLKINNVFRAIEKIRPDFIIYSAGITKIDAAEVDQDLALTLNEKIPGKIAKFISPQNIPFIYVSSDAVFDGYKKKYQFAEDDKTNPKTNYGISKLKGEEAVLRANENNTVIRLITLFGIDYHRPNFLTKTLNNLKANKQVFGITDQMQNPTEVNTAARAISFIVGKQLNGICHVGSLDWDTNYNFMMRFAFKFGLNQSLIKKISFEEFMKSKNAYRKKKSVLLCNKLSKISNNTLLKTIDESFDSLVKEYKKADN